MGLRRVGWVGVQGGEGEERGSDGLALTAAGIQLGLVEEKLRGGVRTGGAWLGRREGAESARRAMVCSFDVPPDLSSRPSARMWDAVAGPRATPFQP